MHAHGLARIGKDAEVRYTTGGEAVASLSLAFSYGRKGEDGRRPTQWVDASLWGKRAESLAPYLTKGQAVAVTLSEVHIEQYKTRDGTQGQKLVARVDDLELAGGAPEQRDAKPAAKPAPKPAQKASAAFDDMDGDIPF